jgi:Chitobiase/beta-hexosaminidase C-terminal domain/Bacterial Ig-like domain (group 2)
MEFLMNDLICAQETRRTPKLKKRLLLLSLLLPMPVLAQTLYLYPTTAIAPSGSYQTVTAVVAGVNDKTVTWTADGGTLVGTNPCVANEPCTIALYTTDKGTYHVTATSNADGSVAATSTINITASPTVTTGHPRLLFTAAMLPGLQAKATAKNVIYQAIVNYTTANMYTPDSSIWKFSTWNATTGTCTGGSGPSSNQTGNYVEVDANSFALLSMIAPTAALRNQWGCAARDVWTYVMQQMVDGNMNVRGNEWSDESLPFSVTTDWLMAGNYLSPTDLTLAHQYAAFMLQNALTSSGSYNEGIYGTVPPNGPYDSSSEFIVYGAAAGESDLAGIRWMGNNYTESRLLYLAALSLTFDDNTTDDPPLTNTCSASRYEICPDWSAGSLHAYFKYFDGALLYLDWAHLEDPNVSWQAYQAAYGNLPTQPTCQYTSGTYHACFGDGRQGESSEGSWYQYSMYRLRYALNILYTTGYNDPILYGPQVSLGTSSWWDMKYVSDLEFLTGYTLNNGGIGNGAPSYSYLTTGDSNTYYHMPADFWSEAAMLSFDTMTGRTDRTNALEWGMYNMAFGGPSGTSGGCLSNCGFDYQLQTAYAQNLAQDLFFSLPAGDPVSTLPSDPRPSLPTDLYNGSFNQHQMVRSGWTNPTLFSYYCGNTMINHEDATCGRFDVFSNNEYITKGRTEFTDYNSLMASATQSNQLSIMSAQSGTAATAPWTYAASQGGEWWQAQQAELATLNHSELPAYAADIVDETNLYNGWWNSSTPYSVPSYDSVTAASRSLIYLRGTNQVVFYDRAVTKSALAKAVYLNTTGAATIASNTARWPTRSATQEAYFTTLLPAGAVLSDSALTAGGVDQSADWEPYSTLEVSAGTPLSAQFLSVLQWGESSFSPDTPVLVQSASGNGNIFDGAVVGSSQVMFMRTWPGTLTTVTYPAEAATQYVSDLTPNTSYTISGAGAPSSASTDTAGVLEFSAPNAGNITITPGTTTLASITVTTSSSSVAIGATQQYTATCNYADGASLSCTDTVSWTSSATGVAGVNSTGLVTGVAVGSASIVATIGTIQGKAAVTVVDAAAATPTFNAAAGTYTSAQTVTISSATTGATIYYTTNGATPTTNSTVYSGPITVSTSETIEAIAVASGYSNSAVGSAVYTISVAAAGTPTFSPAAGTYTSAQTVTISSATTGATIYYTSNGTAPTTSSTVYSGTITVSASETVEAIAVASGYANSAVGSAVYTINASATAAATPTFSPAAGTYTSAQTVTISSATTGATLYYTTNGTAPTTSSPVYSGPVTVSATETLEAIATASGYSTSAAGSAAYTIASTSLPTFSITVSPTTLNVTTGQSGAASVLVTPQNSFSSAVSFSCTGLPSGASCSFVPPTVTPSGATASTTLTVSTSATASALHRNSSPWFPGSALAIAFCCLSWKKRRGLQVLMVLVALLTLGFCSGCGGATISPQGTAQVTTSTFTVVATSGSQQQTASVTLMVQ